MRVRLVSRYSRLRNRVRANGGSEGRVGVMEGEGEGEGEDEGERGLV